MQNDLRMLGLNKEKLLKMEWNGEPTLEEMKNMHLKSCITSRD